MATPSSNADHNLLFGILALQMDFIDGEALIAAMHAWVLKKSKPLGQILVEQLALGVADRDLLEALVQRHLQRHRNDAQQSLAVLSGVGSLREDLRRLADADLQASVLHLSATRSAEEPVQPTTVGQSSVPGVRFRMLREHARGGLGAVFVAHDEELNRQVALKEIQPQYADHPDSRARFLLEAEVTGGLEHPGVVPVYGLGRYPDGRPFYAMRFIKGASLHEAIQRFHQANKTSRDPGERSLAFRELLGRFVDACNALAYAHARGVLHRDVKPRNIMLGNYGETLVVDWGLAKVLGHRDGMAGSEEDTLCPVSGSDSAPTQTGKLLGTLAYMSPEQADGRLDDLGPASDIYNLGATLYELLTGREPVQGSKLGQCIFQVQRGDWPPPRKVRKDVPPALEAVCLKAMALKPEDRYRTALALAADIEHWLADEPVSAYREPFRVRRQRWMRRHRGLVAGAAAALWVGLTGLAIGLGVVASLNGQLRVANTNLAAANTDLATANANEQQARKRAENVLQYLVATFRRADPEQDGRNVTVAEVLKRSVQPLTTTESLEPAIRGSLLHAIGQTYVGLGLYREAVPPLERALALQREQGGPDHPDTFAAMNSLAVAYERAGRRADALPLYAKTLKLTKAKLGPDHPNTLASMHNLASAYAKGHGSTVGNTVQHGRLTSCCVQVSRNQRVMATSPAALCRKVLPLSTNLLNHARQGGRPARGRSGAVGRIAGIDEGQAGPGRPQHVHLHEQPCRRLRISRPTGRCPGSLRGNAEAAEGQAGSGSPRHA
jgi:tetratricopeptide (TPR) repeat protein